LYLNEEIALMPMSKEKKAAYDRAYRLANKAKKQAQDHAWYLANKDHCHARTTAWRLENPERQHDNDVAWRENNRDKLRAEAAVRREENGEEMAAYQRQWRLENPEKSPEYSKRYRETHLEQRRAEDAAYAKAHPEKRAEIGRRRRARKKNAAICDLTDAQWQEIQAAYNYRCVYCPPDCWRCRQKKHKLTQDHLTPLNDHGDHTVANIVPACGPCNSRKHTGPPPVAVQPLLLTIAPSRKPSSSQRNTA
jgi:hypothetical protein